MIDDNKERVWFWFLLLWPQEVANKKLTEKGKNALVGSSRKGRDDHWLSRLRISYIPFENARFNAGFLLFWFFSGDIYTSPMSVTATSPSPSPTRIRRTRPEIIFDDIESIHQKMDDLYAIAKVRQSELDYAEGRVLRYNSVTDLIHDLAD
jgi:hypothetical protein